MAVKRRLRVRAPIERRLSKSSRNAPTKDESICRSSRFDGCNLQVSLRELQQQPEGVSVGGNRVGTHIALTNQSSGEEALDQCRQGNSAFMACAPGASPSDSWRAQGVRGMRTDTNRYRARRHGPARLKAQGV